MSNVPEGAQLSDDGQWYWDGSQWQAVEGVGSASSPPEGSAGAEQGAAAASPPEIAFSAEPGAEPDLPETTA